MVKINMSKNNHEQDVFEGEVLFDKSLAPTSAQGNVQSSAENNTTSASVIEN